MSDEQRPIELLETDEEPAPIDRGLDERRLHAWLRSGAAIAVAASAIWAGTSVASIRDAERQEICFAEVQTGMFGGPDTSSGDLGDRLVERARSCGLPLTADVIEQRYVEG